MSAGVLGSVACAECLGLGSLGREQKKSSSEKEIYKIFITDLEHGFVFTHLCVSEMGFTEGKQKCPISEKMGH